MIKKYLHVQLIIVKLQKNYASLAGLSEDVKDMCFFHKNVQIMKKSEAK